MALETFLSTLNNAYLQRHLLAVNPATIREAVQAGGEFLEIRPASNPDVRAVLVSMGEAPKVEKIPDVEVGLTSMEMLLEAVKTLTKEVSELKAQVTARPEIRPGHVRKAYKGSSQRKTNLRIRNQGNGVARSSRPVYWLHTGTPFTNQEPTNQTYCYWGMAENLEGSPTHRASQAFVGPVDQPF